jgi:exodeoxyribonuclease VII large subunit
MTEWLDLPFDDHPPAPPPLSVSEVTARLRACIESRFGMVHVEGEVSNCRHWSSGHLYFTLRDDYAQLRAVVFRTTARQLKFKLEDGMHVVARGRISVYEVKGEYQMVVDAVEPHGLGALQAAFEQLKRRLQAEGLFDQARKRALPVLPRRIGVVTSLDGAAVRDILRVITARYPSARVVVRPARVQGDGAARDLVLALNAIARVPDVDVIIVGRGGGSVEDLWAFNDEGLARAIAACPVPVISAVGHEVDFTIADFVADVRAATPSNAAEIVVDRAENFLARIGRADQRLRQSLARAVDRGRQTAARLALKLRQWPVRVALRDRDVDRLALRLSARLRASTHRQRDRFDALRRRLERRDARQVLAALLGRVQRADDRLRHRVDARHASADARLRQLGGRLDALSPLGVLARGYAVCWNEARTSIIRSRTAVRPGDAVRVTLADGDIGCRVESSPNPGNHGT